jgi:hypothetical protein
MTFQQNAPYAKGHTQAIIKAAQYASNSGVNNVNKITSQINHLNKHHHPTSQETQNTTTNNSQPTKIRLYHVCMPK